jgi:hypothetical protein
LGVLLATSAVLSLAHLAACHSPVSAAHSPPSAMNRPVFVGDRRVWRYAARASSARFRSSPRSGFDIAISTNGISRPMNAGRLSAFMCCCRVSVAPDRRDTLTRQLGHRTLQRRCIGRHVRADRWRIGELAAELAGHRQRTEIADRQIAQPLAHIERRRSVAHIAERAGVDELRRAGPGENCGSRQRMPAARA